MNLALDTNAYSDFVRGVPARVELVERAELVYLPLIVLSELRAGFANGTRREANEAMLSVFLHNPFVSVLLPDEETSVRYAEYQHTLRNAGTPIPTNDIWIAALAAQHRLPLCTSDRHFRHLPEVITC